MTKLRKHIVSVLGIASALTVIFLAQGHHSSAWVVGLTGFTMVCAMLVVHTRLSPGVSPKKTETLSSRV